MVDSVGAPELLPERQLSLERGDRTGREHHAPIAARLGDVLVDPRDAGIRDAERPVLGVVVRNDERDLLGRPESLEEPELIIVSLGFAPIPMERRNEPLGFPDAEGSITGRSFLPMRALLRAAAGSRFSG